jgi:DNA modification methylase
MEQLRQPATNTALPENETLTIVYRPIAGLKANPNNPRIHKPPQIRQIAKSIQAFGPIVPLLIDNHSQVIAGHGRLLAAKSLGLSEFPTICVDHLSEAQIKAFAIADNKLTENAEWDKKLLAQQLKSLLDVDLNFDLEKIGFEVAEADFLIEGLSASEDKTDPADDYEAGADEYHVSSYGDLWLLDRHRVLCGNSLEEESLFTVMAGNKAQALFSDPPYNLKIDGCVSGLGKIKHREFPMASGEMSPEEFTRFLTAAFQVASDNCTDGSLHYICMDWRHLAELTAAGARVYQELKALCVWNKGNGGMGSLYRSQHELIFVFKKVGAPHRNNIQLGKYGRYRTNVWSYPGANSFARRNRDERLVELHPTAKPVALVADAILDCTARKDIVLDPFLGSGTTVLAAERVGRACYGIELDPMYIDTTVRRWQKLTGKSAKHANNGLTFAELERRASDDKRDSHE